MQLFKNSLPKDLQQQELTTANKGIVVLYGRKTDGSLIAIQVDDNGVLASNVTGVTLDVGTAIGIDDVDSVRINPATEETLALIKTAVTPSANAFYIDNTVAALTTSFVQRSFGFTSISITVANDDTKDTLIYSFNGVNTHGRLRPGEGFSMDNRAHSSIWLKKVDGIPTPGSGLYRSWSY